jgi:hypothetical protein
MGIKAIVKNIGRQVRVLKGEESKDKYYTSRHTYKDRQSAEWAFTLAKEKLFQVNKWSHLPGISSRFRVYDPIGNIKASGIPQLGDYIFINLPGPTPQTWVKVLDISEEEQEVEFTVSPSPDPRERGEEQEIDHFLADEATSTFRVALHGNTLVASEIGRDQRINNQGEEAGGRQVINTLIAVGGWAGLQELQWRKLTDYLVHKLELEDPESESEAGRSDPLLELHKLDIIRNPSRLGATLAASLAGTTAMTAMSYGLSRLAGKQFREPELLSYLMYKNQRWTLRKERRQASPRGFALHYLVGIGFGTVYEYLWRPAVKLPSLASGAVFGIAAGLVGVAGWEAAIQLRKRPPALDKVTYYPHLILGHMLFGATAALVAKRLNKRG